MRWVIIILVTILLSAVALAANNPGHDSLYIEQEGSSELNGSLNITSELKVTGETGISGLKLYGDSTIPATDISFITADSGGTGNLYLGTTGNLYLKYKGGDQVQVGSSTLSTDLNVTGTIWSSGNKVCLSDGTNCINGNNSGNVTSVTGTNGISTSPTTGDVVVSLASSTAGAGLSYGSGVLSVGQGNGLSVAADSVAIDTTSISTCTGSGQKIIWDGTNNRLTCGTDQNDGSGGYQSSAAGWTNTSTTTSTDLDVNITTGYLTVPNGYLGVGTSNPGYTLDVSGTSRFGTTTKTTIYGNYITIGNMYLHTSNGLYSTSVANNYIRPSYNGPVIYFSGDTSDGAAAAHTFNTANSLTANGDKLLVVQNAGTEEFSIDKDGKVNATTDFCITGGLCLSQAGTGSGDITDVLAGTGINVTNPGGPQPTVSINNTWLDANYVGQNEYPNLDTDSTDDLTTSTSFNGDVSGAYNNLQLGTNVVGDNELNYSQVTLGDFTNDAGFLTSESQNLSSVLAQGNSAGSYNIDMNNNLITNIGNAGTDFTTGGGLTLAGTLNVQNNLIQFGGSDFLQTWATGSLGLGPNQNKSGDYNTLIGNSAGKGNTQSYTTLVGYLAGYSNSGYRLTATGYSAGHSNTGYELTATGYQAGYSNSGGYVTATGQYAGYSNSGSSVTATGYQAGYSNTGDRVTATGYNAGRSNSGSYVTATGQYAGSYNSGVGVTATGSYAGHSNTGYGLTATGYNAGYSNSGSYVTATGYSAGSSNSGSYVTATGYQAGYQNSGNYSSGYGSEALRGNSGNNVVAIGYQAGKDNTADNQFIIKQANVNTTPLIQGNFSSGYVGIGTTSPGATLDVNGTINATTDVCITGGVCLSTAGAGSMSSFTLAGDTGTSQTITDGNTLTIAGGTGITTTAGATDTATVALTGQALAFHNLASNGLVTRTGSGTVAARTITAGTGISVSNGDGVSGNPTITNNDPGSSQNIFKTISGDTGTALADTNSDTLTLNGGGITSISCEDTGDSCTVTSTEADTLSTVTSRGATTSTASSFTSTANPGLTVGDGTTGYLKIGGSTIYDSSGNLILDSDTASTTINDNLIVSGTGTNTIAGNTSFDSGTLYIDSTNNRVGVGTTSPGATLDVAGNASINNTLYVTTDGKVGVGTSSPSAKLHAYDENITGETLVNLTGKTVGAKDYVLFGDAQIDETLTSPAYYYPYYLTGSLRCNDAGCGTRTLLGDNALVKIEGTRVNTTEFFSGAGLSVDMDVNNTSAMAVVGVVSRANMYGIYSASTATSGTTYGVYGTVSSPDGWGLYTPDNASVAGWLKIGTGTPENASGSGDLYVTSDIEYDGNLYGPGADVAERTPTSEAGLTPGMVVEIDPEAPGTVRKSSSAYSKLVAGVVSTKPGIILGKDSEGVELAVTGRVPVKVNTENGPIKPGDLLTTSSTPGEAMACRSAEKCFGAILGKAMEPLATERGKITALVTLG